MAKDRLVSVSKYWAWGGLKFTSLSVWPEDESAITSPDHLAGDWLEIDNCAMCDEGCIFTLLTWRLLNWCSEQRTTTQLDQFYRTASSSDILATSTTYLYIYTLRVWIIRNVSSFNRFIDVLSVQQQWAQLDMGNLASRGCRKPCREYDKKLWCLTWIHEW